MFNRKINKRLEKHLDWIHQLHIEVYTMKNQLKERQQMATLEDILINFGTFYMQDDSQEFLDETIEKIKDVLGQ